MKRFLPAILCLLACLLPVTVASAATVTGTLTDITGTAIQTGIVITSTNVLSVPPNTVLPSRYRFTNSADGTFSITLVQGNYMFQADNQTVASMARQFSFYVPGGTGSYDIEDLVTTAGNFYNQRLRVNDGTTSMINLTNVTISGATISSNTPQSLTLTIVGGGSSTNAVLTTPAIAASYGLIDADAVIIRNTSGNEVTNIFIPIFTNVFDVLTSGDTVVVNVLASWDPSPWIYDADSDSIADGTPGYIKGKSNIRFVAGRPGAGIDLTAYGHGFTLEATTNIVFDGLYFNGVTNGMSGSTPIVGMINHRSPTGITNWHTAVINSTLGNIPNQFLTHAYSDGGRKSLGWTLSNNRLLPGGHIGVKSHPFTGLPDGSFMSGAPDFYTSEGNILAGGELNGPVYELDGSGNVAHTNRVFGRGVIRDNQLDGVYNSAFVVMGNNSNLITGATFEGNYVKEAASPWGTSGALVHIKGGTGINVLNNHLEAAAAAAGSGRDLIAVNLSTTLPGYMYNTNVTIAGNTGIGGSAGIEALFTVGLNITGNNVSRNGAVGIQVGSGVDGANVGDNRLDGQGLVTATTGGILLFSNDANVLDNIFLAGNTANDSQATPTTDYFYRQSFSSYTPTNIVFGHNTVETLQSGATAFSYGTAKSGTVADAQHESGANFAGTVTAEAFVGPATGLTSLPADVAWENIANTFTHTNEFSNRTLISGQLYYAATLNTLALDWSNTGDPVWNYSTNAAFTITFSGTPLHGQVKSGYIENRNASAITVTIPQSYDIAGGALTTSLSVPASSTLIFSWRYVDDAEFTTTYLLSYVAKDNPTLTALASDTIASTEIFIGTGAGTGAFAALSGDATMTSAGVVTTVKNKTIYINAGAMIPNTTSGAAAATLELATNDIMQDSMDFDAAADEFVGAWFTLPSWYVSGNVAITLHWTAASGSGDVYWAVGIRAYPESEAMDQSITLSSSAFDTLTTAGDLHVGPVFSSEAIQGTGEAANVPCYIKISRDADNGSDNLAADAKLLGITIQFP